MWRLRFSIVALLGAAVAGCNEPGELYQRPPAEVRDLLRTVEVPLYMFGSSTDTQASVDVSDPAKVVWKVTSDGSSLMWFTAQLIPEGEDNTRVVVDIEGSKASKYGDVQARLQKAREIRALYLASMTEAVDSTLDGRALDITATYPALMFATAANAGRMFPPSSGGNDPSSPENRR